MHIDELTPIIEAALLAAPQPLSRERLASLFQDGDAPAASEIAAAIDTLREACAGRGVELVEVASGYRYQVREDVHTFVARLWAERPPRYSRALLETLALIAYRQPITRGEIEQVRGVVVSTGIIRTLEEREWIRIVGYRDVPGKPALYGTTRQFLDYFKLKSLDQLPPLAEVRDMEAFEPQLDFDRASNDSPAPVPALASAPGEGDDVAAASDNGSALPAPVQSADDAALAATDPAATTSTPTDPADDNETMIDEPNDNAEASRA